MGCFVEIWFFGFFWVVDVCLIWVNGKIENKGCFLIEIYLKYWLVYINMVNIFFLWE